MPPQSDDKRQAAREVIDILHEISILLVRIFYTHSSQWLLDGSGTYPRTKWLTYWMLKNTNLDRTELSLCVSLIENGVNPDALAVSPTY